MKDPVTRLNAALEGRYRIESELGEGGMANVYLADDLKHERKVALKVLKPELAAVVGAERFLAEIKTTANLQHPHILPLHDSGEADGFLYYVMPYVEGESLRERLDRDTQLPVDEAVRIASDMADALDYAHRQGVVHRDIKPANVLLHDGRPLIADFGIALAMSTLGGGRLTETGLSVGTPRYMSPEQATGDQSVGPATDVYSLGCVLYEMLVGEPPFNGSTPQAILGKIIAGKPESVTTQRKSVPANVDAAILKALEKLPADRFKGAQEFGRALADVGFSHGVEVTPRLGAVRGQWTPLAIGMTGLALVLGFVAGWSLLRPEPALLSATFPLMPPEGSELVTDLRGVLVAIAPDGQRVVYVGPGPQGDGSQLWQRRLNDLQWTPIAGTEGGDNPVFSPDGLSLAFWSDGSLKTVSLLGGSAIVVTPTNNPYFDWAEDGMLYFVDPEAGLGISRVPATGGQPEQVADPVEGVYLTILAEVLPDGRGLLVTVRRRRPSQATVGVVGPDGGKVRELFPGVSPRYDSSSGHIVYATADNTLMAAPFDLRSLNTTGPPVAILQEVDIRIPNLSAQFSLSETGTAVYRAGTGAEGFQLQTFDFEGNTKTLGLERQYYQSVSWSPDGESIVYSSDDQIYTYNVSDGTLPRPLTSEGINTSPAYSPDGTRVAFSSERSDTDETDLFVKDLNDDSPPRAIITLEAHQILAQWPSDSLIVFEVRRNTTGIASNLGADLWWVDLSDPDNPQAQEYLSSEADLRQMVVSPDESQAAYRSTESGRREIYVRSFPNPGEPTLISRDGGNRPLWSPDGNTLYYLDATSDLAGMAAHLQRNPVPVVLSIERAGSRSSGQGVMPSGAALHPDGDRFIMAATTNWAGVRSDAPDRLILLQNFSEELKRLVPN